jgi:hypothetical protein
MSYANQLRAGYLSSKHIASKQKRCHAMPMSVLEKTNAERAGSPRAQAPEQPALAIEAVEVDAHCTGSRWTAVDIDHLSLESLMSEGGLRRQQVANDPRRVRSLSHRNDRNEDRRSGCPVKSLPHGHVRALLLRCAQAFF